MIFDSIKDKCVMNTICGVVGFISVEAGRRYNVLQAEELKELKEKSQKMDENMRELFIETRKLSWRLKKPEVTVMLGERKKRRGRPVKPILRRVA